MTKQSSNMLEYDITKWDLVNKLHGILHEIAVIWHKEQTKKKRSINCEPMCAKILLGYEPYCSKKYAIRYNNIFPLLFAVPISIKSSLSSSLSRWNHHINIQAAPLQVYKRYNEMCIKKRKIAFPILVFSYWQIKINWNICVREQTSL